MAGSGFEPRRGSSRIHVLGPGTAAYRESHVDPRAQRFPNLSTLTHTRTVLTEVYEVAVSSLYLTDEKEKAQRGYSNLCVAAE